MNLASLSVAVLIFVAVGAQAVGSSASDAKPLHKISVVKVEHVSAKEDLPLRHKRSYYDYRRYPTFAFKEIPRDSAVSCRQFCDKVYNRLLRKSYYFDTCMSVCATIDECSTTADCVGGASCVNTVEGVGFICLCPPGFTGDGRLSGSGCTDIDECASGTPPCSPDANCTNTEGGFICQCPFGFNGDGRLSGTGCDDISSDLQSFIDERLAELLAADVNECDAGMDNCVDSAMGGVCTNTIGSFDCSCQTGFTGDGVDPNAGGTGCGPTGP